MVEPAKKTGSIRNYSFRGHKLEKLIEIASGPNKDKFVTNELISLFDARVRRRLSRGQLKNKYVRFVNKIRKSKAECPMGEKPKPVKTHFRNMVVLPEMVGGIVGIYNGKDFVTTEIKFDMIGKYLGEFAMSYKPTTHGRPGVGATKGS